MTRPLPAPEPNVETQPFWDAAAEGRLLIKRCGACGEPHYYPRALCPFSQKPRSSSWSRTVMVKLS